MLHVADLSSVIDHQSSVVSHQSSVIGHLSSVLNKQFRPEDCKCLAGYFNPVAMEGDF